MGFKAELIRSVDSRMSNLPLQRTAQAIRCLSDNGISIALFDQMVPSGTGVIGLGAMVSEANAMREDLKIKKRDISGTIKQLGTDEGIEEVRFLGLKEIDVATLNIWSRTLYQALYQIIISKSPEETNAANMLIRFSSYAGKANTPEEKSMVAKVLFEVVRRHHPDTAKHMEETRKLCGMVARKLGMTDEEIRNIELAAYLHDIGKIGMSKRLLDKRTTKLTAEDINTIHLHVVLGVDLLKKVSWIPDEVIDIIRYHHYTNKYPEGLDFKRAPIGAKILAIADSYDAMIHRTYRKPRTKNEAIVELRTGMEYDQRLVDIFVSAIRFR